MCGVEASYQVVSNFPNVINTLQAVASISVMKSLAQFYLLISAFIYNT